MKPQQTLESFKLEFQGWRDNKARIVLARSPSVQGSRVIGNRGFRVDWAGFRVAVLNLNAGLAPLNHAQNTLPDKLQGAESIGNRSVIASDATYPNESRYLYPVFLKCSESYGLTPLFRRVALADKRVFSPI